MARETQLRKAAPGAQLHALDSSALARMSMAELDELFAELAPAAVDQLQGSTRGHVVALTGLDWLPAPVRRALFERGPWQGQHLDGAFGANAWLPLAQLEFARYLVHEAPAIDGGGTVLRLDYDVAANPKALRGLVGELRALGPGSFLVRMYLRTRGRTVKLSYFILDA